MASRTCDLVGRVHPAHQFDLDALLRYASSHVHAFPLSPSKFSVSQFGYGQSNPTFLLEVSSGSSVKRYVLRKKPPGKLLESAHAVEREFQVIEALGIHTQVPVPKVFCLCTDSSVIGTPFYIMEYLDGRIFLDPGLPGLAPKSRRAIYQAAAKALASLHSADVDTIGLGKFGRRENYCKRQVERWAKQYIASTGDGKSDRNPKMLELVDWLRQHVPLEDSLGATSGLVHGDFRIDNLVFHPLRVIGILDWELSTLETKCVMLHTCMVLASFYNFNNATVQVHLEQLGNESENQDLLKETGRFVPSKKVQELRKRLIKFMEDRIYPMENEFYKLAQSTMRWTIHPEEENLKELAKREGLWNLFIPFESAARAKKLLDGINEFPVDKSNDCFLGAGLSNLEYGYLCEVMGRSVWAPQMFNCGAPDTGNMEVLLRYGDKEQLQEWLIPLLEGKIRSGFAMTEPEVASSDATNIECSIKREGDSYIINGKKWWTSGAMDPRCRLLIVMGKADFTAPMHKQQSMILVDIQTPGMHIQRPLTVFGFDDAPHGHAEISFENVSVPAKNILLGEGRGFEIAQGRLGPGRLHHCLRLIGAAERGMQIMVQRALRRKTFGKFIAEHGSFRSDIAKVAAPNMALKVLDMAIQVHGAAGVSSDTVLAHLWATSRTLRIADGPDEVHLGTIAKLELQRAKL
ncbi:putative acyl-CoA dehydrogenase IBR3 [Camellia lanceoleosa]|uniref:Acyl-CoA dehydrogenase IBR3 n=1 Tax=Camellia lanceoleosa TaxID=1840588 RepID=A0ACC0GTF3_9ERIC|nr:putative acyl-CoA dehydrogenase IBR3 [Camellia lanceoleosa]